MAYTKYSLTPANNTAAPPDGAPEGMLPSAVNDTMRDMMAQIRDCGDGIRGGTYTMTAPIITGGTITGSTINNSAIGGTTAAAGNFTTLGATGVATFSAGAVGTPAITTTGDTNTGIFFPAADTIAFTEGGVESMRITSAGDVGIGTTTPNPLSGVLTPYLTVQGASYDGVFQALGSRADGAGAGVGQYNFLQNANTTYKTIAQVTSETEGTTANNRGGRLMFFTKADAATSTTERMRIDSSGNVGIGTTSPAAVTGFTTDRKVVQVTNNGYGQLRLGAASGTMLDHDDSGNTITTLRSLYGATNAAAQMQLQSGFITFGTGTSYTERMRIDSSGRVLVGTTTANPPPNNVTGLTFNAATSDGSYSAGVINASANGQAALSINRATDDGTLVNFYQAGTVEGSISVSGTTVSYNGGHLARWSQLPNNQKDDTLFKGTVMSNLDEMCIWTKDGEVLPNEQLNKMKVSDVEGDTNVAGVFVNWDNEDISSPIDMNVAMTGDMIIRIADGVVVQKGDLLMSAGDGTAKPQGDDIVRSKTIAKVTSNHVTCTYADGSYCVPCVLMAC